MVKPSLITGPDKKPRLSIFGFKPITAGPKKDKALLLASIFIAFLVVGSLAFWFILNLTHTGSKSEITSTIETKGPIEQAKTSGTTTQEVSPKDTGLTRSKPEVSNTQTTIMPRYSTPSSAAQTPPLNNSRNGRVQPIPSFHLELSPPPDTSSNPLGFMITIMPDAGSEHAQYSTPAPSSASNGAPCNHSMYTITYNDNSKWGWSCVSYVLRNGEMPYGEYPVVFTVTGTNGYGESATRTVSGTIVYHADQMSYENRF